MTQINDLPIEIIGKILEYSSAETKWQLLHTDKRFNTILKNQDIFAGESIYDLYKTKKYGVMYKKLYASADSIIDKFNGIFADRIKKILYNEIKAFPATSSAIQKSRYNLLKVFYDYELWYNFLYLDDFIIRLNPCFNF